MTDVQVCVGMGEIQSLQGQGKLICLGLGSCVALALIDPQAKVATLAHIMLPTAATESPDDRPAKFAGTGVMKAIEMSERLGATRENLQAAIVGGAQVVQGQVTNMMLEFGTRNVHAVQRTLSDQQIECVASETGGTVGRSMILDLTAGTLIVRSPGGNDRILHRI
jgi:chemotaxis protein CheD